MQKEIIFNNVKEDMKRLLETLSLDNKNDVIDKFTKYGTFLDALINLPDFEVVIPETAETLTNKVITATEIKQDNILKENEETFTFQRRIRGGIILGLDNGLDYLVPEKMIRDVGLYDGDLVRILSKKLGKDIKNGKQRNNYKIEVVKSEQKEMVGRKEYRFCVIKEDNELGMYVEASNGMDIEFDGELKQLFILERDINQFKLIDGDIVDIAFNIENPENSIRVIHKEEDFGTFESELSRNSIRKKPQKTVVIGEKIFKDYGVENKELFKGKKLLMVGGGNRHADFKIAIEELGAEFIGATGSEQNVRLESMITSCDAMVVNIRECSHSASIYAVNIAKKNDIAYGVANRNGIQMVVKSFEEVLVRVINENVKLSEMA